MSSVCGYCGSCGKGIPQHAPSLADPSWPAVLISYEEFLHFHQNVIQNGDGFDKNRKIKEHDLQAGKNYLGEKELLQYENIGEQLLLRVELRILRGGRISMEEWFFEINRLLQENGYQILFDYTKHKYNREEANQKAKEIYDKNKNLLKSIDSKKLLAQLAVPSDPFSVECSTSKDESFSEGW